MPKAEAPKVAHLKSEYKRLKAQGADVLPPINQGATLPKADTLHYRLVAGEMMTLSLEEFMHRCAVRIEAEQDKPDPNTADIALWCEAIRLAREVCRHD